MNNRNSEHSVQVSDARMLSRTATFDRHPPDLKSEANKNVGSTTQGEVQLHSKQAEFNLTSQIAPKACLGLKMHFPHHERVSSGSTITRKESPRLEQRENTTMLILVAKYPSRIKASCHIFSRPPKAPYAWTRSRGF